MQAVLDLPVAAPEGQELGGAGAPWGQAGQRVGLLAGRPPRPLAADVLDLAHDAADLAESRPSADLLRLGVPHLRLGEIADHLRRALQRAPLLPIAMPIASDGPVARRPGVGEAERHRLAG